MTDTKFAVINSVPGSDYTSFQIKVWNPDTEKSELYAEGFNTRISAKHAADDDPALTRVGSFREAKEHVTGVPIPAKKGHSNGGRKNIGDEQLAAYLTQMVAQPDPEPAPEPEGASV